MGGFPEKQQLLGRWSRWQGMRHSAIWSNDHQETLCMLRAQVLCIRCKGLGLDSDSHAAAFKHYIVPAQLVCCCTVLFW